MLQRFYRYNIRNELSVETVRLVLLLSLEELLQFYLKLHPLAQCPTDYCMNLDIGPRFSAHYLFSAFNISSKQSTNEIPTKINQVFENIYV